jgi:hypothetical protein
MSNAIAGSVDTTGHNGTSQVEGKPEEELETETGEPEAEGVEEEEGETQESDTDWEAQYKEIQSAFSKATDDLKGLKETVGKFDNFGGADKVIEYVDYLTKDPEFANWVKSRQSKNAFGIDESQLQPEEKQAVDLVQKMIKSALAEKEAELERKWESKINPVAETVRANTIQKHFGEMDSKYGEDWREMNTAMDEILASEPDRVKTSPSFEDIEHLYIKALLKEGKMDDFASKIYEKNLKNKTAQAADAPSMKHGKSARKQAETIMEAYEQAIADGVGRIAE